MSGWFVGFPPCAAKSAFIRSIIEFMFALLVASICAICLACWSCSIAKSAGQMAVFLTLVVVVGLRHSEDTAELIFELVNGLRRDHAVEACQFVAEVD